MDKLKAAWNWLLKQWQRIGDAGQLALLLALIVLLLLCGFIEA